MSSETVSSGQHSAWETSQIQSTKEAEQAAPKVDVVAFRETDEGKNVVSWALQQYRVAKSARESEERDWKTNLAMYNGKQYLEVLRAGKYAGQLIEKPKTGDEKKTINRIEPLVRTEISRLVSQKPSAVVLPSSADDSDMFAAMAGEQIWQSHSHRRKFFNKLTAGTFWLSITGNMFIKTFWDDTAVDTDANMTGDIIYESVNPFNLLVPDLREEDIQAQPWVCNFFTKSIEWCRAAYPEALEGVELTPNANAANEVLEESYLNLSGGQQAKPDSVLVYEFWLKPGASKQFPDGGYLVIVDTVLVAYSPDGLPYSHGEFPFAHTGHLLTGKFYRRSVINSVRELQKDYNSWRTQLGNSRVRMARPQFFAVKGSITASRWSNATGLVVEVRPGFQFPQPIPMAQMPAYAMEEGQAILTDIEDISGQHQVSKGNVPPGVTAATAISYLQEKDDSYMTPTYQSLEDGCEVVARHTLALVVQFWDVPRMVKVGGDDSMFDVLMLQGSDIANGTDIRTEAGSSLPTSKAAKQAFILDLMNSGHVESSKGLEMLEVGGASKLIDQLKIDKRQAQRENVRLKFMSDEEIMGFAQDWAMRQEQGDPDTLDAASGQPLDIPPVVQPNSWDNHAVHIETHNLYRRSQAYEFLSDTVKQQFEAHVRMHEQMMLQDQLRQALEMIPTDGSTPGVSGLMDGGPNADPEAAVTGGGGEGVPAEAPMAGPPQEGGL